MRKIIFDTNMMYNLLSLRNPTYDKYLLEDLINEDDCYLSSVSIIEEFSILLFSR